MQPNSTNQSTKAERDQRHDKRRWKAKPWRRWYGTATWKRIRKTRLAEQPLCAMCSTDALPVAAAIVDHARPHNGIWSLFFDYDNTQSLCKRCHDSVKQRLERFGETGCDADGMPLDPARW